MHFHGTVANDPASILLDSGCGHSVMSAAYARQVGIIGELPQQGALQVAAANALVCSSIGTCKVCFKLQQLTADLSCHAVKIADAYEVILGDNRLQKYSATLSYAQRCCVLDQGSQRFTLVPGCDDGPDTPVQTDPAAHAAPVSALQADRALRQPCQWFVERSV